MYQFNKILVTLDNTDIDEDLIYAASYAANVTKATDVYFINIIKDVSLPAAVKKEFPDLMKNAIKERQAIIEKKVDKFFENEGAKVHVEINSGSPTKAILKYSAQKNIDLIIMGRKNEEADGGVIINRVARRAGCSLMIYPKGFRKDIQKIIVPIDFSNHSLEVLGTTLELAEKNSADLKVISHNVFQVPSGYHYTGKSFNEFAEIMKENLEKDYKKWSKKLPKTSTQIETLYTLDRQDDVTTAIYKTAVKKDADAIIISVKGITSTTALFLGSKAEKLIQYNSKIPLIVLRRGEKAGLIDYLKKL